MAVRMRGLGFVVAMVCLAVGCEGAPSDGRDGFQRPDFGGGPGPGPGVDGGVAIALPKRSCETELAVRLAQSATKVEVGGEWNRFDSKQTPLALANGVWKATVTLPPGAYGYKVVVDGTWQLDPSNPDRKWIDTTENSVLVVEDCTLPRVDFVSLDKSPDGRARLEAQLVDGANGNGMGAVTVLLDGAQIDGQLSETGRLVVDLNGLAKTKHRLSVRLTDAANRAARSLEVPFWIEDQPFEWTDGMMYFVFTDRFKNGDPSNDRPTVGVDTRANYQGGDFAGVMQALDDGYFDSLGVRTIWLSPPNKNPDGGYPGSYAKTYTGYHGYWPMAGRETQPRFGTVDELKRLVKKAHDRGIRVIVDSVLNHVHELHPLYLANRYTGWFGAEPCVCTTDAGACNWDTNPLGCWFTTYLPDIDYKYYAVDTTMIDDALFWAEEVDVDGFRVDAVKHFLHAPTRRLRSRLRQRFEHAGPLYYLVGETFTGGDDGGRQLIKSFVGPEELHAQFDFPIYWNILGSLGTNSQSMRSLEAAATATDTTFGAAPMSPFFGNHDVPRFVSQAAGDVWSDPGKQAWDGPPSAPAATTPYERLRLALSFLMTQPGVPLIYYGDEVALPGAGDPDNRRFMKWSGYSVEEQKTLDHAKKLGAARKELAALRRGKRATLWIDDDFYLYARVAGSEVALVAVNRGGTAFTNNGVAVAVPAAIAPIPDGTVLRDRLGGASITKTAAGIVLNVPPRTSAVWAP